MNDDTLFPDNDPDWRELAVADYQQQRESLIQTLHQIQIQISDLSQKQQDVQRQINDLDQAARVFRLPGVSGREEVVRRILTARSGGRVVKRGFKDIALDMLKEAYPKPLKASQIRAGAEQELGETFHPKTAGMTLYRLSQEEDTRVRREGHSWYYVPQKEEGSDERTPEPS